MASMWIDIFTIFIFYITMKWGIRIGSQILEIINFFLKAKHTLA